MKKLPRKSRGRTAKPPSSPSGTNPTSPHEDRRRPRFSSQLFVLYEDDAVVAIDKPAGLPAVPIPGSDTPSALSLLSAQLKPRRQRALIVHRIDRFASGVLLFAKTAPDRNALVRQFLDHTPVRQYLALLRGRIAVQAGTLVHYLRREGMWQRLRTARDSQAARAELSYWVERLFANASLVRVELVTGLQNQIRAQFAAVGHPLIGDRKYHRPESTEPLIDRVALHAARLQFVHPRSGESVSLEAKLPPDLRRLIQELLPVSRPRP